MFYQEYDSVGSDIDFFLGQRVYIDAGGDCDRTIGCLAYTTEVRVVIVFPQF